jgi:ribonuclease VapC
MTEAFVLDSYAVLALLRKEPGGEEVARLLRLGQEGKATVLMSWVNAGEVVYIVQRRWGKSRAYQALATLEAAGVQMVLVEREATLLAANIKAEHPLAYADAFAAALALDTGAILVTGDPEFRVLEEIVSIHWLAQET